RRAPRARRAGRHRAMGGGPPRGADLLPAGPWALGRRSPPRGADPVRARQDTGRPTPREELRRPVRAGDRRLTGMRPLVTIVTPSFNHVRFIRETTESVLTQ